MISFIKAALREIDHVVWPTEAETRKYFTIVTIMIGVSTVVLFTFGTFVSKGMFAIRAIAPHDVSTINTDGTAAEDILKDLNLNNTPATDPVVTSGPAVVAPAVPAAVTPVMPAVSTGTVATPVTAPSVSSGSAAAPAPAAKTSTGTAPSVPATPKK